MQRVTKYLKYGVRIKKPWDNCQEQDKSEAKNYEGNCQPSPTFPLEGENDPEDACLSSRYAGAEDPLSERRNSRVVHRLVPVSSQTKADP